MVATTGIEVREWLEREWRHTVAEQTQHNGRTVFDGCPIIHLLPDLLRLVETSHERSIEDLEPAIRLLISESLFSDSNGDTIDDLADPNQVDLLVDVAVRTLRCVRDEAVRRGAWSLHLPSIPMCG